jgi:phosphoenolpyruvate synthase/pyruvate phosphate dikinase
LQREVPLNKAQLIEVAQLVLSLEATMSYAVDVECAYAGGKLYLLQCRPITMLK